MIILWVSGEMLQSGYVGRISQSVYILQCCTYNLQLCTAHRTRDIPLNYIATTVCTVSVKINRDLVFLSITFRFQ